LSTSTSVDASTLWNLPEDAAAAKEFHEIYDLAAIRILVKTNEECYRALAVVHDAFRPIQAGLRTTLVYPSLTAISPCIPLSWHQWASIRSAAPHWKCIKSQSMELQLTGNTRKQEVPTTSS